MMVEETESGELNPRELNPRELNPRKPNPKEVIDRLGIEPGALFREYHGEGNSNNRVIEIRNIIDDVYIVFRWWSVRKKMFRYDIQSYVYFEVKYESGTIYQCIGTGFNGG